MRTTYAKSYIRWTLLLCFFTGLSGSLRAQTQIDLDLDSIARQMQEGVYERLITLGYMPSPDRYRGPEDFKTHLEYTFLFLRFYGFEKVFDRRSTSGAYVGKVFMSERYLERDYNKKYTSRETYRTDIDGFFYACKLYYDERVAEYRLSIYPDHLLNICRAKADPFKASHFNKRECKSMDEHWHSLKHVIALPDRHYDHFIDDNDTLEIQTFLRPADTTVNIHREYLTQIKQALPPDDPENALPPPTKLSVKAENMLREINLKKQIKNFRIDKNPTHLANQLTAKFTKYPLSEDMIEGNEYQLSFIPYTALIDTYLKDRGAPYVFMTRNPAYRVLTSSNAPDDSYSPGLYVPSTFTIVYAVDSLLPKQSPQLAYSEKMIIEENSQLNKVHQKQQQQKQPQQQQQQQQQTNDKIRVNEPTDPATSTYWIYAGRSDDQPDRKYASLIGKQYVVPTDTYLRDAVPVLADAAKNLWGKGNINFTIDKGRALRDEKFTVLDTAVILNNGYRYVWLQIQKPQPKQTR
ncbi:MAG: hypothetical protein EAZ91_06920 [Cytophagales bacterium]|nr:MAG: hypothetical protein EAZ91_06920 [Cytophagales bacterium]